MTPSRELYWNIEGHFIMYFLMIISFIFLVRGSYQQYRLWKIGKPVKRTDQGGLRLRNIIDNTLGHTRLLRDAYPGSMHFLIFWGFLILFIGTIIVGIEADLKIPTLYGTFYLYFSLFLDLFGLLAIIGILMAAIRRYIVRPDRLDNKPEDFYGILLILFILVTGFFMEGLRIAATSDPWAAWSPVGNAIAAMFAGASEGTLQGMHVFLWWLHLLLAFGFIAYFPYSKLFHIFLTPLNQYFANLGPNGALEPINFENEEIEQFGAEKLEDFTWKQLLDTGACTRCGRCQDNCPAYLSKKALSPKKMTQDLKAHLLEKGPILLRQKAQEVVQTEGESAREAAAASESDQAIMEKSLIGDVITEEEIWDCTTCRSCQEQCPAFVEHIDKTVELRRNLVLMESRFPSEMQLAFRNMENNGNPWGVGWANRAEWINGLEVKTLAEAEKSEILYWPGCAGAFDERNQRVAKAVVKILKAVGVDFAILGTEEKCCGDSARRLGNEYLFQSLAQENIETMNNYGVKTIITQCPHCFNTLKNEYPQFGGNYRVIHHTEYLAELVLENRLSMQNPVIKTVAYHDSCYLGRYNEVYQEPRDILKRIPGVQLVEMDRRFNKSFCCGAGGGRMWLEEHHGEKINVMRTEQALATGCNVVSTACPFCLTMLGDGLKAKDADEGVVALDVAEILAQAL
ncbi:MAG: heterodisulfide reductase-related iron-sulfur binding cluster [Bacillota bacterium]